MESLFVRAVTLESGEAFCAALADFRPKLVAGDDGRYQVEVPLAGDAEIVAVLNALLAHVTQRNDGAARLELGGRDYTLHPDPS